MCTWGRLFRRIAFRCFQCSFVSLLLTLGFYRHILGCWVWNLDRLHTKDVIFWNFHFSRFSGQQSWSFINVSFMFQEFSILRPTHNQRKWFPCPKRKLRFSLKLGIFLHRFGHICEIAHVVADFESACISITYISRTYVQKRTTVILIVNLVPIRNYNVFGTHRHKNW